MSDALKQNRRFLIVNADDFGMSAGVNRGILHAHERGIVTSASLMVRRPMASDAVALARQFPRLSIGLHVDLGGWVYRDEKWVQAYAVLPPDQSHSPEAVAVEVCRQIDAFHELTNATPTHLDSHQHVHQSELLRPVFIDAAARLGAPLRGFDLQTRYCGDFYGQNAKGFPCPQQIGVEALIQILRALPQGTTELGCHPGSGDTLESIYCDERTLEVQSLCDPRVREAINSENITLISFDGKVCP